MYHKTPPPPPPPLPPSLAPLGAGNPFAPAAFAQAVEALGEWIAAELAGDDARQRAGRTWFRDATQLLGIRLPGRFWNPPDFSAFTRETTADLYQAMTALAGSVWEHDRELAHKYLCALHTALREGWEQLPLPPRFRRHDPVGVKWSEAAAGVLAQIVKVWDTDAIFALSPHEEVHTYYWGEDAVRVGESRPQYVDPAKAWVSRWVKWAVECAQASPDTPAPSAPTPSAAPASGASLSAAEVEALLEDKTRLVQGAAYTRERVGMMDLIRARTGSAPVWVCGACGGELALNPQTGKLRHLTPPADKHKPAVEVRDV